MRKAIITRRAWLEIDLDRLHYNLTLLRAHLAPSCEISAVLKANAYGQGAVPIARYLQQHEGITRFCVACLSEAVELREAGITGEILMLAYTTPELAGEIIKYDATQSVASLAYAHALDEQARLTGGTIKMHIKLDTGMTRTGFNCKTPQDIAQIYEVYQLPNLRATGTFSHFSSADDGSEGANEYCHVQIERFNEATAALWSQGCQLGTLHMCNTGGIQKYPQAHFDMVRCGAEMAGYNTAMHIPKWDLKIMTALKVTVISLRDIETGTPVSYSRTFKAEKTMRVAVLSIGYADGYPRNLSRVGRVMLHGKWARQLGNVCMDQMMVDVTDIPEAQMGDAATIIGEDGDLIQTADDLGAQYGSCMHEVLSRLGERLQRLYYRNGKLETIL
ncbi:MAG TPA: alanine racemase [Clostridia bacterium]|nr:alanine racemase [Clostridia bacterium]